MSPTGQVVGGADGHQGRERAARSLAGGLSKKRRGCEVQVTMVNGEPGAVFTSSGAAVHVMSLRIEGGAPGRVHDQ